MLSSAEIAKLLLKTEPFVGLPLPEMENVVQASRLRKLRAKEILFHEKDPAESGFTVVDGRVALLKNSLTGRELIVELLMPGEMFGFPLVIHGRPFPVTARAQIASRVLAIPKRTLLATIERFPEVLKRTMAILTKRMEDSQQLARALAHDRVEVRIALALLAFASRLGSRKLGDNGNTNLVEIEITRQELADSVGTSLESASRIARELERAGVLDLSSPRRVKILDFDQLSAIASGRVTPMSQSPGGCSSNISRRAIGS